MVRKPCYAISLLVLLACLGCGAKNSEKVLGVWRSAEKRGAAHGFIEIRKDKLIKDGNDSIDIALEDKDDKVSVRLAGTDQVLAVITVVDDKNIEIAFHGMFTGGKEKLVKSSADEMNAAFNPPKEKIIGIWRDEKEEGEGVYGILEIAADALIFDGERVPASLSTKKGVYIATAAQGGGQWHIVLDGDGKLHLSAVLSMGRTFVRSSPDEAAAVALARVALVERHYGFWKEVEARYGEPFGFLEIGDGYVDDNGERTAAVITRSRSGLKLSRQDDGKELMTASLDESGHLRVSKGYFGGATYERGSREELEKTNNPKIEHIVGFWLLDDPEADSYKTIVLAPDYIVRDRRREETKLMEGRNRFALAIARREPKEMHWFDVTRSDDNHITLSYGGYDKHKVRYRRAEKAEYEQAAAGTVNPLDVIVGYWRSAEPVEDTRGERVVHATAVFATDVKGEKAPIVDWSNVSFIDSSNGMRNRSLGDGGRAREGVWIYPMGRVSVPFELYDFDQQRGSWVQIKIVDADTLDIAVDGRNFVRCVRSNQEEVVRLRAMIKR